MYVYFKQINVSDTLRWFVENNKIKYRDLKKSRKLVSMPTREDLNISNYESKRAFKNVIVHFLYI